MKNKSVVKKLKEGLKIAAITTMIVTTLTSCNPSLVGSPQDFASQESVSQTAEFLECDMSYVMKEYGNYVRMKHNNGEPIYICFDESYSDDLKTKAIETLDYVFGIVGKINANYHYKIIDKTEFWLKGNKTKIYYTFGECVSTYKQHSSVANAHMEIHSKWYNFATENPVYFYYELNLNKDQLKTRNDEETKNTLIHELLHAFGLGDVYTDLLRQTTTKFYGNTFMNCNIDFDIITPNDLACLISLYGDDCDMEKMKQGLKKYEEKFYSYYAKINREKIGTEEDFQYEEFDFETAIIVGNLDGTKSGYTYRVSVRDGKYVLEIHDSFKKEIIDRCFGEVFEHDGVLVLKNVDLKHGMRPYDQFDYYEGGFVQDFVFVKKNGKDILYNYYNNDGMNGDCVMYEKSLAK